MEEQAEILTVGCWAVDGVFRLPLQQRSNVFVEG